MASNGQEQEMTGMDKIERVIEMIDGCDERNVPGAVKVLATVELDNRDANSALGDAIDDLYMVTDEGRPEFITCAIRNLDLALDLAAR